MNIARLNQEQIQILKSKWQQKCKKNIKPNELCLLEQFSQKNKFKNVVNILDVYQSSEDKTSDFFLIMEYADQGDLVQYLISNKQMDSEQRKQIMKHVALGLGELHQQNLVHRNISPQNILVFKEGDQFIFKINDFGLTKQVDEAKTVQIGNPYYMAPELLGNNKNTQNYQQEVDIWALGCIYYEIITGNTLFNDRNDQIRKYYISSDELKNKITNAKQPWIDSQIDQLSQYKDFERERKLLKFMISIDPKRRPKIQDVVQTLNGSDELINGAPQKNIPKINPNQQPKEIHPQKPNPNQIISPNIQPTQIYGQQHNPIINYQQPTQVTKSISIEKQKELDFLQDFFQQRKDDLEEEIQSQFNYLNDFIQRKRSLDQRFFSKLQQIRQQYEQKIKEFDQFVQSENSEEIQAQIKNISQQSKQLKITCQSLQNEILDSETERFQSLQQQQIDELQKQQINELVLKKEELTKLIQEMQQINHSNEELHNQLNQIISNFQTNFAQFEQLDMKSQHQDQLTSMTSQLTQLNSQCVKLKNQIEMEASLIQRQKEYKNKEIQSFIQQIDNLKQKTLQFDESIIQEYEKSYNNQLKTLIDKYTQNIQEIGQRSQSISTDIIEIQYLSKQMQSEYFQLLNDYTTQKSKQQEKIYYDLLNQKSSDQVKQRQIKEYLLQKQEVAKLIQEMESLNIYNDENRNEITQIKSNFQNNNGQFEQFDETTISSEQLKTMNQKLIQLNTQCAQLKMKIELEGQQIQRQQEQFKNEFVREVQSTLQYIESLRNKILPINQQLTKEFETNYNASLQKIIQDIMNTIIKLANNPYPVQKDIIDIQENRKQMQLKYESLQIKIVQDTYKENERLMSQVQKEQESQYLEQKDQVNKLIEEMDNSVIQNNDYLKKNLNEIKSQFEKNIVQFGQKELANCTSQQIQEKSKLLKQLLSQCNELKTQAQIEVQRMQMQKNENERLLQQQYETFQLEKETVNKLIEEIEKNMIQNNGDLKYQLNEIKAQYQQNFAQFGQIELTHCTSQQIQEKSKLLNQLSSQCNELKTKAQRVQLMQNQFEQIKLEFEEEVKGQLQKIRNLQTKAISIDLSLQKHIEQINQKIADQLKLNHENQGDNSFEQQITNIRNIKSKLRTEFNQIIEKLLVGSSESNSVNIYFNQVSSNYRSKLDKIIEIVTQTLSQININLTELQQIQQKTYEVNILIEKLNNYQGQYERELLKYQQLKQKQFDQTQLDQIQKESDEIMQQLGQIGAVSQNIQYQYSQVNEQFKIHLIHTNDASKINNEYIQLLKSIKQKKNKMNEIMENMIKDNRTIKSQDECEQILKNMLNEENIEDEFKQFMNAVDEIHNQNTQQLKSFQDIDKDLQIVNQEIQNIQEYIQNLKLSEEKDIEQFEADIRFTPTNINSCQINQVKLRTKIKDQVLVRKIVQMKDQNKENKQ